MPRPSEPHRPTERSLDIVMTLSDPHGDLSHRVRELQTELEVARSKHERFLTNALDALAAQIAIIDEHGRILAVNRSWRAFALEHGLQAADSVKNSRHMFDRLPKDVARQVAEGLREVTALRKAEVVFEYALPNATGDRWFSLRITRFADDGSVRLMLANEDVTPRRQAEEAARHADDRVRQAQKMDALGRLAGGVAHDFNNVLTAIKINAENLLMLGPQERPQREDLEEISRAADRATALTQQLLAFSRKEPHQLADVDLNAVVSEAERLLRRLIGSNIELATDLQPLLRPLRADSGQLQQIVMNLAINGRDAMPRGGRLTLQTRNVEVAPDDPIAASLNLGGQGAGHYVQLVVGDTGVGMDPVTKARIFEPFFTTKEQGHGTGLGLATVFSIVRQCAGHISVASEPGAGTTFRIWLPCPTVRVQDPTPTPEPHQESAGHETVLIVEDEPSIRRVARLALISQDYQVIEAGSGEEALAILAKHQDVALVVSDVMMPGMDGSQLCAYLRATRPDLPIILMSGYIADKSVLALVQLGSVSFMQKPFSPRALALRVREVLDARQHAARPI